jgi:UDP-2-acetamido-3-amino-2,3-dideoxy-glucuronate N-acetyltransferase
MGTPHPRGLAARVTVTYFGDVAASPGPGEVACPPMGGVTSTAQSPADPTTGPGGAQEVPPRVEASADVDPRADLGPGTLVWHLAQVREHARVGRDCVLGRGAYVGPGVVVGDRCKLQNNSLVYEPAVLGDGVFIGPAVVLTNDLHPRAVTPEGALKGTDDWDCVGVTVGPGAAVGARSVCVAPVTIGAWSMVAAGSVVTRDVPDHALVVGSPARQVGWVGRAGVRLVEGEDGTWSCPRTGETYRLVDGRMTPLQMR